MSEEKALTLAELTACSFERWYPGLRQHTIPSTVLPLDGDFVEYLKADGVFVACGEGEDAGGDDSWDEGGEEDAEAAAPAPRFPDLEASIASAISKHGGAVMPKLNWSAPIDAAWMLGGSLKCVSPRDVLLLLKSSDRIAHDLCDARRLCAAPEPPATEDPPVLVLRRWSNLHLSSEFRCFRAGGRLLCACQRDRYSHYPTLAAERGATLQRLERFSHEVLRGARLPDALVWDAYVDADGRVYVLDVAPFHESTDPLLFAWPELRALAAAAAAETAELRLVDAAAVVPSPGLYHGVPWDLQQQGCESLEALMAKATTAASGDANTAAGVA